ncbi:MAG: M56 family metallopeptidase [Arenimonas sp.]
MSVDFLKLLMELTLACSAAILLVLLLRVPMRKFFGANVAYAIWALVPMAMMAVLIPAPDLVVIVVNQASAIAAVSTAAAPVAMQVPTRDMTPDLVLAIWLLGALACVFWFFHQQKIFLDALGALSHSYENIFLAQNNQQGPAVIGVLQPRIVLPIDFDQRYNPEEQKLVLTHELSHVASGDTRVNFIVAALRCVFWFNPLLHWADGRFRFDQELSTDAKVLSRFPSSRKSYADAMLKTQMASIGLPVVCHWQANHPLKERILMLKKSSPGKMFRIFGFGFVTLLCLGGTFAAWSTQPANIIAMQADAGLQYEIRIDSKIDHVDLSRITLREVPGKPVAVSNGKGERDWSYEFTILPIDSEYVLLKGKMFFGETLVSEPSMKVATGRNASLAVSTKGNGSHLIMNVVVTEIRNGKSSPIIEFGDNDTKDTRDTNHFIQGGNGTQVILSENEMKLQKPTVVSDDEIATPAKLLPSDKFQRHVMEGKNAGKKVVRVTVVVDEKGFMIAGEFVDNFENDSSSVLKQATDLLMKEKYQPAIGKNGKPVPSNITVELYDNFLDT